jgi:hypothetical protein
MEQDRTERKVQKGKKGIMWPSMANMLGKKPI